MGLILLVLMAVLGIFLSKISYFIFKNNFLSLLLAFTLVYILSGFVTYTPDWLGYETWIKTGSGRDLFFKYLTNGLSFYKYEQIHKIFTGIYSIFLIYFINKFFKEPLLIIILFLPIIFLFYTTQIRFFLAYFSLCIALYQWYITNNKITSIIFILFSISNHISIILFLPFIYFFKFDIKLLHRKILSAVIIISIGYYFTFNLIQILLPTATPYIDYLLSSEQDSSILGGILSFLPNLISTYFIYLYVIKRTANNVETINDKKVQFLYRLSLIPFILILIALSRQIIGQRFIIPTVLFQLILIFYIATKYNSKKQNFNILGVTFLYFIFYFAYLYVLTPILIGGDLVSKIYLMLNSNSLIGHWF